MQHRSTTLNDINFSPAQILFGRPMREFVPVKPGLYRPVDVLVDNVEKRSHSALRDELPGLHAAAPSPVVTFVLFEID